MPTVTLLGPQVSEPNLSDVLRELELGQGPFVSITAGWQEREGELEALRTHTAADVQDLALYARAEAVFAADPELRLAHRRRQAELQERQELYRIRLRHAKDAARELFEKDADPKMLRAARRQAIATLRWLDREHLHAIRFTHARFERELAPLERAAVRLELEAIQPFVRRARAVFIAGGHVAILINRLRLFGGERLFAGKPVIAWSAGAMAISEAVVLFHDDPPQGAGNVEVFDAGLGLATGVLPLPHARRRLRLHDATRVALIARRFAPSAALTLDHGSWLHFADGCLAHHGGTFRLGRQGVLADMAAA
jgi:hypothetical protein